MIDDFSDVPHEVRLVRADVLVGIGGLNPDEIEGDLPTGPNERGVFTPAPGVESPFLAQLLTEPNNPLGAVEWVYECEHVGPFSGILPTYEVLTIRGVTIIDRTEEREQFRRYVDWSSVMAALGVSATFRPGVERFPVRRDESAEA